MAGMLHRSTYYSLSRAVVSRPGTASGIRTGIACTSGTFMIHESCDSCHEQSQIFQTSPGCNYYT